MAKSPVQVRELDPAAAEAMRVFAELGVDEDLWRAALARALGSGGDFADLYFEERIDRSLGLEDGAVNRARVGRSLGVGVRVVRGDQTGYAYTEDLSRERVCEAAATAALIASGAPDERPRSFAVGCAPSHYRARVPWHEVPVQRIMPLLLSLNERTFAHDPRITKVRIGCEHSSRRVLVVESSGRVRADVQPMVSLSAGCTAEDGRMRESNSWSMASREGFEFFSEERLERIARAAAERTLFLFEATPAPAGEFPVVLAAGSAGILLHEAIGHGMEADFNRKGLSVYSDRMGAEIAPPEVTIVDDATHPSARGSLNVDDEGSEGARTVLVEGGRLRSYMHDRISARHYAVEPTGNGRRQSFRHAPLPRMRNTYMLPGPRDPEEIVRSVPFGIYAQTFTNGQVRIGAGDFTFYIKTGYLIENGRRTRPIKDTNIIGNGPQCLARTEHVGNDFRIDEGGWTCGKDGQSVPVSLGMPTVKISALTVGGVSGG
jgi:TldD protein